MQLTCSVAIFSFFYSSNTVQHVCNVAAMSFSVIYVKYMYSAHYSRAETSDFLCITYVYIHQPYMSMKSVTYMCSLVGILF